MAWLTALAENEAPVLPRRNPFAWLLALFVPRVPLAGGGGLLVIVAMIGVLAAIAIPAYQDYTIRAQVSEGAVIADQVKTAVAQYYSQNGKFPEDNASLGLKSPEAISGQYVESVQVAGDEIQVVYGGTSNKLIVGGVLAYQGKVSPDGRSMVWNCAIPDTTVPNKWLPQVCRK